MIWGGSRAKKRIYRTERLSIRQAECNPLDCVPCVALQTSGPRYRHFRLITGNFLLAGAGADRQGRRRDLAPDRQWRAIRDRAGGVARPGAKRYHESAAWLERRNAVRAYGEGLARGTV